MNRAALEHLLRAAAAITGEQTFYVVGTAAIVASLTDPQSAPDAVTRSREADLIPASGSPRSIDLIDGALGQDSTFDGTFGYHADGVEFATVSFAPEGWQTRAVSFSSAATNGAVGLCMEAHDLAIAKLCVGREKDLEFVRGLRDAKLIDAATLNQRLGKVKAVDSIMRLAEQRIAALFDNR
jgi:hypothetical protein